MTFLETLLALLLASIVLLQVSRRLSVPYPSMLAMAGVGAALIPGAPNLSIDPTTALALFIAPALMDAAFDFPVGTARRLWAPLLVLAVGGVVVTAAMVSVLGWAYAGLPLAAAAVLGAIVAPPDAAAATAVLSSMAIPRATDAVLRGESLFNDASALLLFGVALAVPRVGHLETGVIVHLSLAVPGGIALGVLAAWIVSKLNRFVAGTLGGNLLQFIDTILLWVIAERLGVSAVLAVVAFAMRLAGGKEGRASPRMRVQSYAVWSAVVFVLNVIAFLVMGMQARKIIGDLAGSRLGYALGFSAMVVAIVIAARVIVVVGFNRGLAWYRKRTGAPEPATLQQAILASWCGMRGLVTLATAFALPADFPQRDVVVLAAFAVVLATLVVQGLSLGWIIRLLGLDRRADGAGELKAIRGELAAAALTSLDPCTDDEAHLLRSSYRMELEGLLDPTKKATLARYRDIALTAIKAQRRTLEQIRSQHRLNSDEYNFLLEDLDWRELTVLPDEARRIEES